MISKWPFRRTRPLYAPRYILRAHISHPESLLSSYLSDRLESQICTAVNILCNDSTAKVQFSSATNKQQCS